MVSRQAPPHSFFLALSLSRARFLFRARSLSHTHTHTKAAFLCAQHADPLCPQEHRACVRQPCTWICVHGPTNAHRKFRLLLNRAMCTAGHCFGGPLYNPGYGKAYLYGSWAGPNLGYKHRSERARASIVEYSPVANSTEDDPDRAQSRVSPATPQGRPDRKKVCHTKVNCHVRSLVCLFPQAKGVMGPVWGANTGMGPA